MTIPQTTIENFRTWHRDAWNDLEWADKTRKRMQWREQINKEILELLEEFISGKMTLVEFKTTFDKKTRKDWDSFGLKGMSGAMFLNMLTNRIPPTEDLKTKLQTTLRAPKTEDEGRQKMSSFLAFLNDTLAKHHIPARKIQPRRTPFLLSSFWHMQNRELWPITYESARQVLSNERILNASGNAVDDYFNFRSVWLKLRDTMGVPPWDLELLCARLADTATKVVEPALKLSDVESEVDTPAESFVESSETLVDSTHAEAQWLLAELGQKLGCKVWIAANDHNKQWKGQKLKQLSIPALPNLGIGEEAERIINLIDVIWLKGGKQVVAAFEVESTTSVYSGILRMSDLVTTCPNINFQCYIVIPQSRESLVIKQLSRPTFQSLDLNQRCGFFSIEHLKQEINGMMKWAKDFNSIKDLAKFVADTTE